MIKKLFFPKYADEVNELEDQSMCWLSESPKRLIIISPDDVKYLHGVQDWNLISLTTNCNTPTFSPAFRHVPFKTRIALPGLCMHLPRSMAYRCLPLGPGVHSGPRKIVSARANAVLEVRAVAVSTRWRGFF